MLYKVPPIIPHQTNKQSRLFLTADEHYWHKKIIIYQNRPFQSPEEMNKTLITNANSITQDKDVTIHIGDICFGNHENLIAILRQLKGHHCIMDGSHDRALEALVKNGIPQDLQPRVTILPKVVEFTYNGHKITLHHYLQEKWWCSHHGALHFFGHSHGHARPQGRAIDVGVDPQNFFPIRIETAIDLALQKPQQENHPLRNH